MQNNKTLMGVLAYLGILIVIPFLMSKDDPFVKFHLKQGAVLFVLEAIVWAVGVQLIMGLGAIVSILQLAFIVLSIIGIVNVLQGKEQELPIVGQFSKHFKF